MVVFQVAYQAATAGVAKKAFMPIMPWASTEELFCPDRVQMHSNCNRSLPDMNCQARVVLGKYTRVLITDRVSGYWQRIFRANPKLRSHIVCIDSHAMIAVKAFSKVLH